MSYTTCCNNISMGKNNSYLAWQHTSHDALLIVEKYTSLFRPLTSTLATLLPSGFFFFFCRPHMLRITSWVLSVYPLIISLLVSSLKPRLVKTSNNNSKNVFGWMSLNSCIAVGHTSYTYISACLMCRTAHCNDGNNNDKNKYNKAFMCHWSNSIHLIFSLFGDLFHLQIWFPCHHLHFVECSSLSFLSSLCLQKIFLFFDSRIIKLFFLLQTSLTRFAFVCITLITSLKLLLFSVVVVAQEFV